MWWDDTHTHTFKHYVVYVRQGCEEDFGYVQKQEGQRFQGRTDNGMMGYNRWNIYFH